MRKYRLTIVTRNQNRLDKAEKLAKILKTVLGQESVYEISKYPKFTDSNKIDFIGQLENQDLLFQSVELTDRISSPWTVSFNRHENIASLMFNKSENSEFRRQDFNVIEWCHFELSEIEE